MLITVELPAALNDGQWKLKNPAMERLEVVCDYLFFYYKVEVSFKGL